MTEEKYYKLKNCSNINEECLLTIAKKIKNDDWKHCMENNPDDWIEITPDEKDGTFVCEPQFYAKIDFKGERILNKRFLNNPSHADASSCFIPVTEEKRFILMGPKLKYSNCWLCFIIQESSILFGTVIDLGSYFINNSWFLARHGHKIFPDLYMSLMDTVEKSECIQTYSFPDEYLMPTLEE